MTLPGWFLGSRFRIADYLEINGAATGPRQPVSKVIAAFCAATIAALSSHRNRARTYVGARARLWLLTWRPFGTIVFAAHSREPVRPSFREDSSPALQSWSAPFLDGLIDFILEAAVVPIRAPRFQAGSPTSQKMISYPEIFCLWGADYENHVT